MEKETKKEQKFEPISREIKRQFDLVLKFDESHDTKIQIFLGFAILVIAQVLLNRDSVRAMTNDGLSLLLFLVGTVALFNSLYHGYKGYNLRLYHIGPEIKSVIDLYKKDPTADMQEEISRMLNDGIEHNIKINEEKVVYIKSMLKWFIFGIGMLVFVQLLPVFRKLICW